MISLIHIIQDADIDGILSITLNYSMNKDPHLKIVPAAFMLVLFLVVSFFGAEGTLLCFGEDGHVAIELIDACNGAGLGLQHAEMENDACGHCKDVQFLSSPAHTNSASHYTQTLPPISSYTTFSLSSLEEYSNKPVSLPVSLHHKTLASLHSIVLLI